MPGHPMDNTLIYRLWQAPFAERKLAPLFRHADLSKVRRVLDVGCGPGTNTRHFLHCDYLGVDLNPKYIRDAERRYGSRFRVADVTTMHIENGKAFDCILVNSLLHHLPDDGVERLLAQLGGLLATDGTVHILDLVLPERSSVSRLMARLDRGDFPRPLERWREIFTRHFTPVVVEPYPLGVGGVTFWSMVYFQGAKRR